jgi:hypothetical protein
MASATKLKKTISDPLFTIKLQKGLADRERLPLIHVLSVLDELRQLVAEIGRDLQRRRGTPNATGDFGLEIQAGETGILFRGGSVQANVVVTERPGTGVKAIQAILDTIALLDREDFAEESVDKQIDVRIVRRLSRIARIQRRDHTEMRLGIIRPGKTEPASSAIFGSNGMAAVRSLQTPTFKIEHSVLYGRLFQLLDRTMVEDEEERGFWGELRTDADEIWRIQFGPEDVEKAAPLFRSRVEVTGTAFYYRIAHPKLICRDIKLDRDRDFEGAFDQLYGCDKNVYKTDLAKILKEIRGEE